MAPSLDSKSPPLNKGTESPFSLSEICRRIAAGGPVSLHAVRAAAGETPSSSRSSPPPYNPRGHTALRY